MLLEIGTDTKSSIVCLPFQEEGMANQHLLVTGKSGNGKTYLLQKLLSAASAENICAVVLDYSGSFSPNKMEPAFVQELGDHFTMICTYRNGLPIDPFRRQFVWAGGQWNIEKPGDTADRVADLFCETYRLGASQRNVLYRILADELNHNQTYNLQMLVSELKKRGTLQKGASTLYESLLNKLAPLADKDIFRPQKDFDWASYLYGMGRITVLELEGFAPSLQKLTSEIILWDLLFYATRHGQKQHPFILVLDECQLLSLRTGSPVNRILTEGRKFGMGAWLATQSLNHFSNQEKTALFQAACQIFFHPTDLDVKFIVSHLGNAEVWTKNLYSLLPGECVLSGMLPIKGRLKQANIITKIASFE